MTEELQDTNLNPDFILKIKNLNKKYGNKKIISNFDMSVKKGSIYALIGKNGSGKTTIMRLVLGLANPSSGKIEFSTENFNRKKISGAIENPAMYPDMSASENMICQCYALGIKNSKKISKELLDAVGLGDCGKKKVKNFSLGMKQRLSLAFALIGEPEFLLLDEPMNGLDPQGMRDMRDLILKLNREKNVTFIISSHILGELIRMATDYAVINKGKMVREFSHEELLNEITDCVKLKVNDTSKALELLNTELNINNYKINGSEICISGKADTAKINEILVKNDLIIESISAQEGDYEDYFLKLMGGEV